MANAAGGMGNRGRVAPIAAGPGGAQAPGRAPRRARPLRLRHRGHHLARARLRGAARPVGPRTRPPSRPARRSSRRWRRGGVAAMEVVARDLKALGLYQARALSYHGVEVDVLEHALTTEQRRIYDAYAGAFQVIHTHLEAALQATGVTDGRETLNRNAKSAALSAFEGAKQRFFGHLLVAMKCPTLLRAMEADLEAGRACVVQLVSTGEALLERAPGRAPRRRVGRPERGPDPARVRPRLPRPRLPGAAPGALHRREPAIS